MSARPNYSKSLRHNIATQRWHVAIHKCVARSLQRKFENAKVDPKISADVKLHLSWRLGYNLFYSNQFFEAITVLEFVCRKGKSEEEINATKKKEKSTIALATKGAQNGSLLAEIASEAADEEEEQEEDFLHSNFHVHLTAGRCCVRLFLQTCAHYHLENAYRHYQNCIESMTVPNEWEKKSMLRLPVVLSEMGHLLEHYGAFQSALELYTKVMSDYPNYRGYFDVMYRASLVGCHVSELLAKPEESDSMLHKVIDMLQFLLEALPSTIDECHIVLLYARSLDKSRDPAIRFRANGVFKNLFDHLRDAKRCSADRFVSYKEWNDIPSHWLALGQDLEAAGEPLLAKDCFEIFTQKIESKRQAGKDLSFYIDVDTAMLMANVHAKYQNYTEATKFGEIALKHQRLNKDVRSSLSKWSKIHAVKLRKEEAAVSAMHNRWKSRVWSDTYRKKLQAVVLGDLEERIEKNRYDSAAREDLAYFARDKWRARFLFETDCAVRLQRFMRARIKIWRAQQRLRSKYLNRAVEAYRLWGRKPFDASLRAEILTVVASKHCPRKHILNRVAETVIWQNGAVAVMQRAYAAHRNRRTIRQGIASTRRKKDARIFRFATIIQCLSRCARARKLVVLRRRQRLVDTHAAVIIQRFVRWRRGTFQHAVTMVIYRQQARHRHARLTFVHVWTYYLFRYIKRRRAEIAARLMEVERLARLELLHARSKRRHHAARVLQHVFARLLTYRLMSLAKKRLTARCSQESMLSVQARRIFQSQRIVKTDGTVVDLMPVAADPAAIYHPPGVAQNSHQFLRALDQTCLFCTDTFAASDCMMLAAVLRHSRCRLQEIVLYKIQGTDNPSFEFDLLPAISKCRTMRSISILGGAYTSGFLTGLVKEIQSENPRIKDFLLEGVSQRQICREMASTVGLLMLDYFNYSVPGIMTVSLHGSGLADADIDLIAQSLRVNTSIRFLVLSKNVITDHGLIKLLQALEQCRHSKLACIDLRYNLIQLKKATRLQLDATSAVLGMAMLKSNVPVYDPQLEIFLGYNLVSRSYLASSINATGLPGGSEVPGLSIICSDDIATSTSTGSERLARSLALGADPEIFGVSGGQAMGFRQAVAASAKSDYRSGKVRQSPKQFLASIKASL